MSKSPTSTLSTILEERKTNSSNSSTSSIPSTDMAGRWYDYEDADEIIRLSYPEAKPPYLLLEQDSWPEASDFTNDWNP